MNRQQAKELLPVIEAFARGETIQFRHCADNGEWADFVGDVDFTVQQWNYRVKPKPLEAWAVFGKQPYTYLFNTREAAERFLNCGYLSDWRIVKLREVEEG